MAERSVGIDSAFVDAHVTGAKKIVNRPNLKDGDLPIKDLKWAKTADILVHHSIVHPELRNRGIPIVLAVHGRPESTFCMEHRRVQLGLFGGTTAHGEDHRYKAFITFWEPYMFHLGLQLPKDKLYYVPAMVDLQAFSPGSKSHEFPGNPSILVATMWRHDVTPFNIIMGAAWFRQKYAREAKVNIIGAAPKKNSMKALVKILKGTLGEVHPLVVDTDLCYRGADIVITPHNIATRVVRESLACGTPVVAGTGNPFTPFTADSRDAKAFGTAIDECWTWIRSIEKKEVVATSRRMAEREFGFKRAGEAAKAVYEKVIEENAPKWTKQGALDRKTYPSYDAYVKEQKSKLENGLPFDLEKYDTEYRKALKDRLEKLDGWGWRGLSVLCLGARTGAEVKAFVDLGCFAVGVDLNP
ncbi:MAG: glycosyltransferase, partial [Planctomycetota bacterium]